jgi:hypothetical protein
MVESLLINVVPVPELNSFPDRPRRLKAMCIEYQKSTGGECLPGCIIDAAYNHHAHTSSCFGKKMGKEVRRGNKQVSLANADFGIHKKGCAQQ